ncbi:MAG: GntR family transcriptional regulator, partial [Clostridiales bacterium]|nr:GntR family transcriptional regulator [Clostridiales bacterium]
YKKAVEYICQKMETGELKTGDRISTERILSEKLNISRNSTREALCMLESMGVLERRQGSGNYISNHMGNSMKQLFRLMLLTNSVSNEDIFAYRRHMEKAVCAAIIEKGVEEQWCQQIQKMLKVRPLNKEQEIEQDKNFHFSLIEATENRFWMVMMDAVEEIYRENIEYLLKSADEKTRLALRKAHQEMFEGLTEGDLEKCNAAVDKHYMLIAKKTLT